MIVIGLAAAFAGYTAGIWGYCLLRGYNVTGAQLFALRWPGPVVSGTPGSGLVPVNLHDAGLG